MTAPDVFALTFWRNALSHMIVGASSGALNALTWSGIGHINPNDLRTNVPWWAVLMSAVVGGLVALLYSLGGQPIQGTLPASMVPAPKSTARRRRPPRKRPQAPTTADLRVPGKPPTPK